MSNPCPHGVNVNDGVTFAELERETATAIMTVRHRICLRCLASLHGLTLEAAVDYIATAYAEGRPIDLSPEALRPRPAPHPLTTVEPVGHA